jgi:hypothetical protein
LFGLTVAHRYIDRLAGKIQVHDKLGRAISLARRGIDRGHAESNWIASFVSIIQCAIERFAWTEEVRQIS